MNQLIVVFRGKPLKKNTSQVLAYCVILLVLIPYFLCVTGVIYQMFGVPRAIILNSEGEQYDLYYVHDQESYSATWLREHTGDNLRVYADHQGMYRLISQGGIDIGYIDEYSLFKNKELASGYIYFRYINSIQGKLIKGDGSIYDIEEISSTLHNINKIYDNSIVIYKK